MFKAPIPPTPVGTRRRQATFALLAAILASASALCGTSVAAAKPKKCPNEKAGGATISNVRASGVRCAKAEQVAKPSAQNQKSFRYTSHGFKCKGGEPGSGGEEGWTCKHKGKEVTFTYLSP